MKKRFSTGVRNFIAIIIASCLAYYLLLHANCLHTSISEIMDLTSGLAISKHILVVGLLPIYIAAMVFGTVMFGIYLSSLLQHLTSKCSKNKQASTISN